MEYVEDTLVGDNTDVTDDGQVGKDYKVKCCVISEFLQVTRNLFVMVSLLNLFLVLPY